MKLMNGITLAKELGISNTTLWRLWKNGIIPRVKDTNFYDYDAIVKTLQNKQEFNNFKGKRLN